ncbi:MAG: hypothetical protein J6N72_00670 [Psychrobacter sp.]|nr:hypothetical protein [Psychrobacter sp.]
MKSKNPIKKSKTRVLATAIIPLSILLTGCGSDSEDYKEVDKVEPPVQVDKNDPAIRDQIGRTESVPFLQSDYFVDKVSRIAVLSPLESLTPDNINLYRYPSQGSKFEDTTVSNADNAIGFLLIDDPDLLYSATGMGLYDKEDREAVITRSELDETMGSYLNRFKRVLGPDFEVTVSQPSISQGIDGDMINLTGSVKRVDGVIGATKFPVLQQKRIRDELIVAQLNKAVWTEPKLKSDWGTANAEKEEIKLSITTWAYKGGVYLWAAAYDPSKSAEVEGKYGRFNKGEYISSALHALAKNENIDLEGKPVDDEGNPVE